jgi:ankyrin repeat protein
MPTFPLTGVVCGRVQTIDEIEARRKHDILSMTFYIEQELLRDSTAVLKVLPKLLENQTEVMDQARTKALDDFGNLRKEWHTRDAKDFNNDKKYKDDIVKAIEFKVEKIIELGQLVYKTDKLHPDNFLHVATRNGNAELSTILLSLGFPLHPADNINYKDDMGETILATACRMCNFEVFEKLKAGADVNVVRRDGASALHLAFMSDSARSFEMFEALLEAKADVNVINGDGASVLHLAVASNSARSFEMFETLLQAGADVNVINGDGASALHLTCASNSARSFEMFETLLQAGADVYVVRRDGASVLALSIFSSNARILNRIPNLIEYDECAEISYVRHLSLAFLTPNNILRWLKDGRSARELLGVVCALMASASAERPMKDRLSHVRAFINCHVDLLQDLTPLVPLTVTDVVKQLVLQESDSVFETDPQWTASIERGVVWVNKPVVQHACRWTIQAGGAVQSLAYSADGYRLARAEGNEVVVCDAVSGFEVHRLKGHR